LISLPERFPPLVPLSMFIRVHPWLINFASLRLIPFSTGYQLSGAFVALLFNFRVALRKTGKRPENDRFYHTAET
jgi:hypothetical protein